MAGWTKAARARCSLAESLCYTYTVELDRDLRRPVHAHTWLTRTHGTHAHTRQGRTPVGDATATRELCKRSPSAARLELLAARAARSDARHAPPCRGRATAPPASAAARATPSRAAVPARAPPPPPRTMMSATPEREALSQPPPPPQPPLSLSDPPFQPPPATPPLPQIVHGIDPADDSPQDSQSSLLRDSMVDAFSTLSARVSRAVRLTKPTSAASSKGKSHHSLSQLPCVLLFGDSITEQSVVSSDHNAPGWSALLREAYCARAEVFVRGFSGYNTRWALHVFPRVIEPFRSCESLALQTVVIFFGANDATTPTSPQHVPLDSYAHNLATLVDAVRALPSKPVPVLVTPPALGKSRLAVDDARRVQLTAEYAEACVETGRRLGVPVVDLHAAMVGRACDDDGVDVFLSDGLHLAADGNRLVYELLAEVFAECVPQVCPRNSNRSYPHWGEIDADNPGEMLGDSALV